MDTIVEDVVLNLRSFGDVLRKAFWRDGTKPVLGRFDVEGAARRIRSTVETTFRKLVQ